MRNSGPNMAFAGDNRKRESIVSITIFLFCSSANVDFSLFFSILTPFNSVSVKENLYFFGHEGRFVIGNNSVFGSSNQEKQSLSISTVVSLVIFFKFPTI